MYIEGITVCVDYDDFLKITLPLNKRFLNKTYVVTESRDSKTIKVCQDNNVEIIYSTRIHESDKDVFNRGKGINTALRYIQRIGWVILFDSDIIFPSNFREKIENYQLETNCIYGLGKKVFESKESWNSQTESYVNGDFGYGHFQLFHGQSPNIQGGYNENFKMANLSDVEFKNRWKRKQKSLWDNNTPEYIFHLGIEKTNWGGRVTPRWD